jgi:hypothetical protein
MKKIFIFLLLVFFTAIPALGQSSNSVPKIEIFMGESYIRTEFGQGLAGFNTSFTGNISKAFGITADLGAYRSYGSNTYTALVGPRYSLRLQNSKAVPFVHAMFGVIAPDASFITVYGGGLDIKINSTVALRAFQADYLQIHVGNSHTNNARFSVGAVLYFGNK